MNNFEVKQLGEPAIPSPFKCCDRLNNFKGTMFGDNEQRVLKDIVVTGNRIPDSVESFEKAGPSEKIYFNPENTKAAIVTCGGICPGINDVIRALVLDLHFWYKVTDIIGIRFGYSGLSASPEVPPVKLTPDMVSNIHDLGGTMLGSARGCPPKEEIVDSLERMGVNILFCIGGDGTLRGAHDIYTEVEKRNAGISVIGIPKTIDNDVSYVYRSFGFQTAVAEAKKVLMCAHVEAKCAKNGVGLVKLMGRDAGFIAAAATMASGDVNLCLIPEAKFPLDGVNGLIQVLKRRLEDRHHAVIAVAEGAGTDLIGEADQYDASGNRIHNDIGLFLKSRLKDAFSEMNFPINIKYIDPSYIIRSVPANSDDSIFCADLARAAVNAAMAGKTDMLVGFWHGEFTHVPLEASNSIEKRINVHQGIWRGVLATTGQPSEWL